MTSRRYEPEQIEKVIEMCLLRHFDPYGLGDIPLKVMVLYRIESLTFACRIEFKGEGNERIAWDWAADDPLDLLDDMIADWVETFVVDARINIAEPL